MRRLLFPVAIVMCLTGCLMPTPTDPFGPFISPAASPPDRSPSVVPMEMPLTLEAAIRTALENNPEVAAAEWDVAGAESNIAVARADRWPTLSAEAGYQRYLNDQRLIAARYDGDSGVFDRDVSRSDLVLKVPLFTGGRIINEISAAELLKQSVERRLARTREELAFNVTSLFYAILSQREVIRSLEFSVNTMKEHRNRVENLLAAQKAARVDLLRTDVRLADLRQNLVKEQNLLAVEKRLLANMMGVIADVDRLSIEGALDDEDVPASPSKNLIEDALKARNDYLAARAGLEAQAKKVDVARGGHFPTVSLIGNYGVRIAGTEDVEDAGSIGLNASVPLFEGGKIEARAGRERAALNAARERLRKLALQIRLEVETALLDIRSGRERVEAARQAIEQAGEGLRIERMKYELGSGSMTDVLDAQSALLQSETNYARALSDVKIAGARLTLATGETLQ